MKSVKQGYGSSAWPILLGINLGVTIFVYCIGLPVWIPVSMIIETIMAQRGINVPFIGFPITFLLNFLIALAFTLWMVKKMGRHHTEQ